MLTDADLTGWCSPHRATHGHAFTLYYSSGDKKWVLNRTNHDGSATSVATSVHYADHGEPAHLKALDRT